MAVRFIDCYTVKPAETTWEGSISLSEWDQTGYIIHIPTIYFYRPSQNWLTVPTTTIAHTLKESLGQVLVPFYPLTGRLRWIGGGRLELDCNSMGVQFIEAVSESKLDDFGDLAATEYGHLIPTMDYSIPIHEQPLLLAQFTRFSCGGISLGLSISHVVADGQSALHFTMEWARLARGEPLGKMPFLDRKALRAGDPPTGLITVFDHSDFNPPPPSPSLGQSHTKLEEEEKKKFGKAILKLTRDQIEKLKKMANEGHDGIGRAYTRYEVLAGHIWRCTCQTKKLKNDHDHDQHPTGISIFVDSRSRMRPPLPAEFFGNAAFNVMTTSNSSDELLSKPLGYAASRVREAVQKVTDEYVWSAIDYLKSEPDLTKFQKFHVNHEYPNMYMGVVSWLTLPVSGIDFGWGNEIYMGLGATIFYEELTLILSSPDGDGSLLVVLFFPESLMDTFKNHFYKDII